MTREQTIIQTLVRIADNLVADFDVVDLLTGLADRCVDLLGIAASGVMLAGPDGGLRLIASSNETMRLVEVFELQTAEGPCLDAYRTGAPVEQVDLGTAGGRWPHFAPAALEAGFRSVLAIPLRLRDSTVGALNLFSDHTAPIAESDLLVGRAFADLAAISIVQRKLMTEAQGLNEQLSAALHSRIVIEQAKGVVSERAGVTLPEAFARLRSYARARNLRLTDVAHAAVDGTLDPGAWSAPAAGAGD